MGSNSLGEGAIWEFCLSQNSRMNRSLSAKVLSRSVFYLSQIFTDEQSPFSEQGEPTNVCKQTTESTEHYC